MGLESLEDRRTYAWNLFMFDLLGGRTDAPKILTLINISIPPIAFRYYRFLVNNFHRPNYGSFGPINNMMRLLFFYYFFFYLFIYFNNKLNLRVTSFNYNCLI